MRYRCITIGREFGSGGHKIGQMLADRLGISYYDNELLLFAARKGEMEIGKLARVDEKKENPLLFERNYAGNENVVKGLSMEETLFQLQAKVILDIASHDNAIFVGRCADDILRKAGYPVLSVFVSAPMDLRVERTSLLQDMPEKEVIALTKRKDKRRKKYYESHTKKTWGVPESYDCFYDVSQYNSLYEVADDIIARFAELDVYHEEDDWD